MRETATLHIAGACDKFKFRVQGLGLASFRGLGF